MYGQDPPVFELFHSTDFISLTLVLSLSVLSFSADDLFGKANI